MVEAKKPGKGPFVPDEISLLNFVVADYKPIAPNLLA
jgi:hypothetical protein